MTELEKLSLSQPLTDVYNAMEQDIMLAIAKQLAKDGSISASSEWRLQRLAEAGDLNKNVIEIIASYTGIQSDLLTEALSGAANSVIDKLEPGFRELAKQGFISDTPVPASKSADRAIQTFHKQAASDLNLVNTVMRYKAKQAYVDLVNKTYDAVNAIEDVSNRQELLNTLGKHTMSTVMGAESRSEAVRKCIREFNSKGIPAFVDAAGREWSPEAYINMDIRTTVSNTANAAQDARCDDYGIDLIAVSSHPGARPKCAKDQGKVYSRSNQSGIAHDGNGKEIHYEPLSSTSYGEPDGLFGINCRHKKYPFIDGVNFQRYFPYDKEETDKRYKEIQEQRRLERKVRNTKREADMLNEVGDTEGAKAARVKLKEQRKAYRTYCDEHELTQRSDRLTVSKGSVSADKTQKPLDNGGGSGIMKSRGYDFLDGVLGSNQISKEQSKSLDEIVSVIPKKHLDVIGKTVKEVEIEPNRGRCSYVPESKKLILDPDKMNGSIIHEFGHVLADAYDIYNDPKFINILSNGLDLSNFGEVVYVEHPDIKGQFIFALPADKFINTYQGRIYVDDIADWKSPIPANKMYEYFSVGFDAYFNNADELKNKDNKLYNFIKEMLNDE